MNKPNSKPYVFQIDVKWVGKLAWTKPSAAPVVGAHLSSWRSGGISWKDSRHKKWGSLGGFPNSDSFFILDRNTFPENRQGRRFLRRMNIFSTFFLFGFQVWEIGAGTTHLSLILVFPSTLANFDLKLATMVMLHPTQWCSILRHVVPSWQISHESWKHWFFPWTAGLPHYGWLSKSQSKKP